MRPGRGWYHLETMKTFTLEEAQALLPVLESLLKRAMESKAAAEAIGEELTDLSRRIFLSGGMLVDTTKVVARKLVMEEHQKRAKDMVAEMDAVGVQVKDLESGLLDFPCKVDDEIVLLCWKRGEPTIEYWHSVEGGFRGRQPVDDRFRRRSDRLN